MLDNTFLFEYLEFLLKEKDSYGVSHNGNTNFLFIWEQDNYKDLFKSLLNFTYEKENKNDSLWSRSYLSYIELALIGLNSKEGQEDKQKERDEQKEKAVTLLKEILKENAKDKRKAGYIFQLVVNCFGDIRKEFLEIFLKENKNLEDFKWLSFETNHVVISDAGSGIPALENKIKFYESLLPLFASIDLLEHRLIIEERIKNYKQQIEDSRKRDFIGHF